MKTRLLNGALVALLVVFSGRAGAGSKDQGAEAHGSHRLGAEEHQGSEQDDSHPEKGGAKHGHSEGEAHEEEEEGSSQVGLDKGILEADEHQGIKLAPEAARTFSLKTINLTGNGPWSVPASAKLHSGEEVNLYRLRAGFYKRIDFKELRKEDGAISVAAADLRAGDQVVVGGIGFLRIAELAAFGGAPEGHSH